MSLKTDYKNYVPTEDMGGLRRYTKIDNPDGTVSFQDVTTYEVEGSKYGADDANATNKAINTIMGSGVEVTYEEGTVKITAPEGMTMVTFIAPSNYSASDKYTINDDEITLSDLNGEPLDDAWKQGSPVTFTISGNKAFFKAGGSGKNDTLPPLLGNMTVEVVEGGENDTYTIKMDKLILDKTTEMVGGAQLEWGEEMPEKPGKGTGGIKTWTREEIITTGKPYDGLYLGDVTPSDAVTETLIYLPEKIGGKTVLSPFIILSTDYLGGVYLLRKETVPDITVGKWNAAYYDGSILDTTITGTYLNSILDKSVTDKLVICDLPIQGASSQYETTVKIRRKAWALSYSECYAGTVDGTKMAYFTGNPRRATNTHYWLRSRGDGYGVNNIRYVDTSGAVNIVGSSNYSFRIRPAFVLPKNFQIQQRPDGSYTVWNEQGLMTLGDIDASTETTKVTVNMKENIYNNGSAVCPFIYLMNGYSGTEGALFARNDCFIRTTSNLNYENTDASIQANNYVTAAVSSSVKKTLDASVQKLVKDVTIKYRYNNQESMWSTTRKGFILSAADLSDQYNIWNIGPIIPYFKNAANRILYVEGTTSTAEWWTRDNIDSKNQLVVAVDGNVKTVRFTTGSTVLYIRQSFMLPLTTPIRQLADGSYDLVPEDPALTQTVSTLAETGTPVQLKDIPVSTAGNKVTVKIQETGGEQEYITLRENYDGVSGGYALMRDNTAPGARFHATPDYGDKPYQNSELDTHVQNFANNLNESVRKYLVEGSVLIGVSGSQVTLKRSIFLPSTKEVGYTFVSVYPEGTPFEYFNSDNSRKSDNDYWTRSRTMSSGNGKASYISLSQGGLESANQTSIKPIRPIILVSGEAWFTDNGDRTYTFVGDKPDNLPQVTHTVEVPHGQKVVFRQFTQNQKKQFQTMLVGGVYPPLGDVEPPFKLPEFTGNHAIFGDETSGRIELYESGDLTLYPGTYDFFLVGGGGRGDHGGGAGSGYTHTEKAEKVDKTQVFSVLVGASDSKSEISNKTAGNILATAEKGSPGTSSSGTGNGGNGGSGGGSYGTGGNGGSNGSNGGKGSVKGNPGQGQGTTTRSFGEENGVLFAGGGGAAAAGNSNPPVGGEGGGGRGGTYDGKTPNTPGTPNTGGGVGSREGTSYIAPGGSGIIIVRWNNAV